MTIADRIRIKREQLHMTQEELALKCGYAGKSSISKIEQSGDDITLKKIQRVASALGVSHQYLMGWEDVKLDPVSGYPIYEVDDDLISVEVPDLTPEEMEEAFDMFKHFRSLSPEKQAALRVFLDIPENES